MLYPADRGSMYGALPRVLGNRGTNAFIPGEQGNKYLQMRGTWEQKQIWGTGNIGNADFDFWRTEEQTDLFQGNKGTGSPGRAHAGLHTKGAAVDVFANETTSLLHGRCRDGEHIIDFHPQYLNYPESVTRKVESEHDILIPDKSNTLIGS